ncbi:helix-turn-helix transcriptional regulator [Streptomyces sp. WMMC1477]|uniref:helix-turn-helix transcriptional regulator n=1 Tax=Streptomyces sp. WMMC1477 TaxID=3015155 RepID=UPI0022B6C534|nr:helix-turn-helix transcriptional regulator [Streptomyces sp. WMMC1477]MCZ7432401.1 helix-turn-helix transcriptional regulator [Streptomyces sp. WMMC1477]
MRTGNSDRQHDFDQLSAAGVDLRIASVIPLNVMIIDSDFAVLPAPDEEEPLSRPLVIRGAPLVAAFSAVFEHTWREAAPYTPEAGLPPSGLSDEHHVLARLLADGMKDEAIARTLGVSPRTASRLIADLMQRLGATSRFAAGARAAHHGMLPVTPRPRHLTQLPEPRQAPGHGTGAPSTADRPLFRSAQA